MVAKPDIQKIEESIDVVEYFKDVWERELERPDSARPVIATSKFREYVEEISRTGVVPGRLTIAILPGGKKYLLDGWHRMNAFKMSGKGSVIAEVKYVQCKDNRQMSKLFLAINVPIRAVNLGDKLRALYGYDAGFKKLVDALPFLTFHGKQRGVPVSTLLTAWLGSQEDNPVSIRGNVVDRTEEMAAADRNHLLAFTQECYTAWGIAHEKAVLWRAANISVAAWFHQRMVLNPTSEQQKIPRAKWRDILTAIGEEKSHLEFLRGKTATTENIITVYDNLRATIRKVCPHAENGSPLKVPERTWMNSAEYADFNRKVALQKAIEKKRRTGKRDKRNHKLLMGAKR